MNEQEKHIYLIIESNVNLDSVDICRKSIFDALTTMEILSDLIRSNCVRRVECGLRAFYETVNP